MLAHLSVVSVWASSVVSDADRYVQTVAPIACDPDLGGVLEIVVLRVLNAVVIFATQER